MTIRDDADPTVSTTVDSPARSVRRPPAAAGRGRARVWVLVVLLTFAGGLAAVLIAQPTPGSSSRVDSTLVAATAPQVASSTTPGWSNPFLPETPTADVPPTSPPFPPFEPTTPTTDFIGPVAPTSAPPTVLPSMVPPIVVDPSDATTPPPTGGAPGPSTPGGDEEDCGWLDIPCHIFTAINDWLTGLVIDAITPVLDLITETTLSTPDLTRVADVSGLWSLTQTIANTVYVLFVVAGGAVAMSHETLQTRYTVKEIAPRLVVGFLAINVSLSLVGEAITAANALSVAVLGSDTTPGQMGSDMKSLITAQLDGGAIFIILVAIVVLVLAIVLAAIYVVRVTLLIILVVVAPLALACHASPYTESVARLWWRALFGLLFIQIGQAITLIVFVKVVFVDGVADTELFGVGGTLMNLLLAIVLFYILIRIPFWTYKQIGMSPRSVIGTIAKTALVLKGLQLLSRKSKPAAENNSDVNGSGSRRGTTGTGGGGGDGRGPWSGGLRHGWGPDRPFPGGLPRGPRPAGPSPGSGAASIPEESVADGPVRIVTGRGEYEVAPPSTDHRDVTASALDQAIRAWTPISAERAGSGPTSTSSTPASASVTSTTSQAANRTEARALTRTSRPRAVPEQPPLLTPAPAPGHSARAGRNLPRPARPASSATTTTSSAGGRPAAASATSSASTTATREAGGSTYRRRDRTSRRGGTAPRNKPDGPSATGEGDGHGRS